MAKAIELEVMDRDRVGKGGARAARREGMVPGIIYGGDIAEPKPVSIAYRTLVKQYETGNFTNTLYMLKLGGEELRVIPREVQVDPVRDFPIHVDFLRVRRGTKIELTIPVEFTNEEASPGIKKGGVLNVVRHEVEVMCPIEEIPESFELDLTGLEIGDSIHGSNLKLGKDVELVITDRDFTIATVAAPTVQEEETEEAEAEEGEEAEAEGGEASEEAKDAE